MVINRSSPCLYKPLSTSILCQCPYANMVNDGSGHCTCDKLGVTGQNCTMKICQRQDKLFCEMNSQFRLCEVDEAKFYSRPLPKCFCTDESVSDYNYNYNVDETIVDPLCDVSLQSDGRTSNANRFRTSSTGNNIVVSFTCFFVFMAIALCLLIIALKYRKRAQRRLEVAQHPTSPSCLTIEPPPSYNVVVQLCAQNLSSQICSCQPNCLNNGQLLIPASHANCDVIEIQELPPSYEEAILVQQLLKEDETHSSNQVT